MPFKTNSPNAEQEISSNNAQGCRLAGPGGVATEHHTFLKDHRPQDPKTVATVNALRRRKAGF